MDRWRDRKIETSLKTTSPKMVTSPKIVTSPIVGNRASVACSVLALHDKF